MQQGVYQLVNWALQRIKMRVEKIIQNLFSQNLLSVCHFKSVRLKSIIDEFVFCPSHKIRGFNFIPILSHLIQISISCVTVILVAHSKLKMPH